MRVKQLPWQKVQVKELQTCKPKDVSSFDEFKKFDFFEEKFFTNQNAINDFGLLFSFLKEKNFSYIFNLYFGIDGHETTTCNSKLK
jgi:hypothetical protein